MIKKISCILCLTLLCACGVNKFQTSNVNRNEEKDIFSSSFPRYTPDSSIVRSGNYTITRIKETKAPKIKHHKFWPQPKGYLYTIYAKEAGDSTSLNSSTSETDYDIIIMSAIDSKITGGETIEVGKTYYFDLISIYRKYFGPPVDFNYLDMTYFYKDFEMEHHPYGMDQYILFEAVQLKGNQYMSNKWQMCYNAFL